MSPIAPAPTSPSPQPAPEPVLWSDPERQAQFQAWLASVQTRFALRPESLRLASADASFRRYLRIDTTGGAHGDSLIIMDAPPDKENSAPFVQVAQLLHDAAIRAPEVLDWQEAQGFLLLNDLGARTMMQIINPAAPPPLDLYLQAVDTLIVWQKASRPGVLPPYDHALLRRELELFPQWYIAQHRQVTLDEAQRKVLDAAFETIIAENLAWPSVFVHRDFMPRNLMAPTLVAARTALPPEGALPSLGRPGAGDIAPTLVTARTALPPEGVNSPWGGPAGNCRPHACHLVHSAGPSGPTLLLQSTRASTKNPQIHYPRCRRRAAQRSAGGDHLAPGRAQHGHRVSAR